MVLRYQPMESLLRRVDPRLAAVGRLAATAGDAATDEPARLEPDLLGSADLMADLMVEPFAGKWTGE